MLVSWEVPIIIITWNNIEFNGKHSPNSNK